MLAEPVLIWNDMPITAKGLISYGANVGGGVHVGVQPKGPAQEALHALQEEVLVDGYTRASAGLRDVGEVAVSGLQPLRTAIEGERGPLAWEANAGTSAGGRGAGFAIYRVEGIRAQASAHDVVIVRA